MTIPIVYPDRIAADTLPVVADDPRVNVNVRLRASSVDRVDRIAAEHDWTRAQALRAVFALGMIEWDKGRR